MLVRSGRCGLLRGNMESTLEFARGSGYTDNLYAAPREWVWGPQGHGISNAYDAEGKQKRIDLVFGVGWQVLIPKNTTRLDIGSDRRVFLWVDSPRDEDNGTLNALKRELVNDLMHSALHSVIQASGYQRDEKSLRRSDSQMRLHRTTSVFKIIPDTGSASPERNIATVHARLAPSVNQVLSPFRTRLNEHFHFRG